MSIQSFPTPSSTFWTTENRKEKRSGITATLPRGYVHGNLAINPNQPRENDLPF